MEVKIQCSCGELTYALPEKIVEIIEKAEKEMPGSKEKALKQIEIALHCVINTMLGACLCAGPEGFEVVLSGVLNGIMPIQQANILTMAVDKFERELTEAAKKQGG